MHTQWMRAPVRAERWDAQVTAATLSVEPSTPTTMTSVEPMMSSS